MQFHNQTHHVLAFLIPPLQVTHKDKTVRTGSNCIHVIFLLLYIILCVCTRVCACGHICMRKGVKVGVLMYFVDYCSAIAHI